MMEQSIRFLQALHQGADPDALLSTAFDENAKALGAGLSATAEGLVRRQQKVQERVGPIVEHVAALDIDEPAQQQLEMCQHEAKVLEDAQRALTKTLSDKTRELEERKKNVQALRESLDALRAIASTPPHSHVDSLIDDLRQQMMDQGGRK